MERLLLSGAGVAKLAAPLEAQAGLPVRELIAGGVDANIAAEFAGAAALLLEERG